MGKYRQYVNWVKDSIVRQSLAVRAIEEIGESPSQEDLDKENSINSYFPLYQPISEVSDDEKNGYELYREQNSFGINPYDKKTFNLNFDNDLIWEREEYPDLAYAEVMEGPIEGTGFYLPEDESYNGERIFDIKKIVYNYTTFDAAEAIKYPDSARKNFFVQKLFRFFDLVLKCKNRNVLFHSQIVSFQNLNFFLNFDVSSESPYMFF